MNNTESPRNNKSADGFFESMIPSNKVETVSLLQEDQLSTLWHEETKVEKETNKSEIDESSEGATDKTETAPLLQDAELSKLKEETATMEDQLDAERDKLKEETATIEDQLGKLSKKQKIEGKATKSEEPKQGNGKIVNSETNNAIIEQETELRNKISTSQGDDDIKGRRKNTNEHANNNQDAEANKKAEDVVTGSVWKTINDLQQQMSEQKQQIREMESEKNELKERTQKQERKIMELQQQLHSKTEGQEHKNIELEKYVKMKTEELNKKADEQEHKHVELEQCMKKETEELKKKAEKQEHNILELERSKNALKKKMEEKFEGVEKSVVDIEGQIQNFETHLANANEEIRTEQFENEILETSTLPQDTFSFMLCSKLWSIPFWVGFGIFGLQIITNALLAADLLSHGGDNPLGVPANVKFIVRVTQVIALIVAIIAQDDFRESIGQLSERHAISRIVERFHDSTATKWWLSWSCRLVGGVLGLVVTFFLIVEVDSVFDILLNFTAMGFVASLDNLAFLLACRGVFGSASLLKAEEIKGTKYPCEKRRPFVSQLLLFLTTVAMLLGWLIVVRDQIQGKYLCETIHVEFSDNVVIDLGGFSGFYVLQKPKNIGGHVEYVHNKSKGKFFYDEQAWIFSSGESSDQWKARSAETDSFDLLDTLDSPWVAEEINSRVDVQLDYIKLTCFECDITSAVDGCECDSGRYGVYCEWKDPCAKLEIESFSEGSFGTSIWSVEYELLEGFHNRSIQAYNRPIYVGTKHDDEDETGLDLLLFCGRRWVLTHTGAFEPLKNITLLHENGSGKKLDLIWKDIADYFLEGFHIYDLTPKAVSYISEPTLSSETPIGLRWYDAKYSEDANEFSTLPLPDLNHPANFVLTCATCRNEGIWLANKTCQCIHRTSGDQCETTPLNDGVCDPYFNIGHHDFDGGDCCTATCSNAACGEELTSTFVSEASSSNNIFSASTENHLSGYQQCQDPSLVPVMIIVHNAEHVELKCGRTMILNTTLDADSSFTITGVRLRESIECRLKISGIKSQRYGYGIYPDDEASNIALNLRYGDRQAEEDVYLVKRCLLSDLHAAGATITSSATDPSGKAVRWVNNNTECGDSQESIVQRYAMVVLYYAIGLEKVTNSWLNATTHECRWRPGIACNHENVTTNITLHDIGLRGQIPTEIGLLAGLHQLHLSNNLLSGTIPAAIGSLSQLEVLQLNGNNITGTTPCSLCFLDDLIIDCDKIHCAPGCECKGKDNDDRFPCTSYVNSHALEWGRTNQMDDFCEFNSIQRYAMVVLYHALGVENAALKAEAHECSWEFGIECNPNNTIVGIDLANKGLGGFIPSEIGLLSNLRHLCLKNNTLSSSVPAEISNLHQLRHLLLNSNLLSGSVPAEISNLSQLQVLHLNDNNVTGQTPCTLCHNFSLHELVIDCEKVTCAPGCFCNGTDSDMVVSPCAPSYIDPGALAWGRTNAIDDFCGHNSVQRYAMVVLYYALGIENIQNAWLEDDKHECLWAPGIKCDSSNVVTEISLEAKQLVGYIPTEIGLLSGLEGVHLSSNQLTGAIPSHIAALTKLRDLYLNNNILSGNIPSEIANLRQLQELQLNSNNVTGAIPCTLCQNFDSEDLVIDCDKITCNPGCSCSGRDDEDVVFTCTSYVDSNALEWARTNKREDFCQFNSVQRYAMVVLYHALGIEKVSNTWLNDTAHECLWAPGIKCDSSNVVTEISLGEIGMREDIINSKTWKLTNGLQVGDIITVEGYLMDQFCINLGVLLDAQNRVTLQSPDLHSLHCLLDVERCYTSPYEVLIDPEQPGENYTRGYRLNTASQQTVLEYARSIGRPGVPFCTTCTGGDDGVERGLRLSVEAYVTALADTDNDTPPIIDVINVQYVEAAMTMEDSAMSMMDIENGKQLVGYIPTEIGLLSDLENLDLSNNQLAGEIPSQTAALTMLRKLDLSNNELTGEIPSQTAELTKLQVLSLGDNQFTGMIPTNITRLAGLEEVRLERNFLTGVIPPMIGRLSNLNHASLNNNFLNGTIPTEINNLSQLQVLHIHGNDVTGTMPCTLCDDFGLDDIIIDCEKIICAPGCTCHGKDDEDALFLCVSYVSVSQPKTQDTYANDFLSDMNYFTDDKPICGMDSVFDLDKSDRRFKFSTCNIEPSGCLIDFVGGGHQITHTTSLAYFTLQCEYDKVMTGLSAVHDLEMSDRRWTATCSRFKNIHIDQDSCVGFIDDVYENDPGAPLDFTCNDGKVLTGIRAERDWRSKDRRFSFKCCSMIVVTEEAYTNSLVKADWTDFQNEYRGEFDVSSIMDDGAHATFCGVSTEYSQDEWDRVYKFKFCKPSGTETFSHILTEGPSERNDGCQNEFDCPENKFVTGIKSGDISDYGHRYFEYYCSGFDGWITDDCLWTEWVNAWYAKFDFECGDQHVISGIESLCDGDRLFKFKCCRLWRQVHD